MTELETVYVLEFNEAQQNYHYNSGKREQGTNGWATVADKCTDVEFKVFESLVNARLGDSKKTVKQLKAIFKEAKVFTKTLAEYGLQVGWIQ